MASLLGWLGNTAKKVERQVNPFDGGATFSHPAAPQRPQPPQFLQRPQFNNQVLNNRSPVQIGQQPIRPAPLPVGHQTSVTPLNIAQTFTRIPAEIAASVGNKTYHPGSSVQQFIFGKQPIKPVQQDVKGVYQAVKAGHQNLPGGIPISPKLAAPYAVADAVLHIGQDLPVAGLAAKGIAKAAKPALTQLDQAGKLKLPNLGGQNQSFHYTSPTNGYTKLSGKASDVHAQLTKLNEVGAVGKNVNGMPKDFLNVDPKVIKQNAEILQTTKAKAAAALDKNVLPENKATVNEPLSKMPAPRPDLPPTPPHTGNLAPMQSVPTINKLFSNKVNVLRKINTPSSHALADTVQNTDQMKEALRAGYMAKIPTVHSLNNNETSQMFDVVEKKIRPSEVSPKVNQAVKEWNKLTPQIHQNAFTQGAIIGERQNYVPHSYPNSFWTKQNGSVYDNAIQHLMDKNQIDHQSAVNMFQDLSKTNAERPNWFGNFENARLTDLPGYNKTKATLYKYIEGAANRTSEAHHLGLDNQIANKLLQNIRLEGGDVTAATKAMENYLHSPRGGIGAKTLQNTRGMFGAARLGKAVISHAGQTTNTAVDTSLSRTAGGWGRYLSRNKADKQFVADTGVTNPQVLHGYQDQYTSVKGGLSRITAPGLNQMMTTNRSVTALAYRGYGNALAKAGKVAELRKLGVTGDIGNALSKEQELQVARGGVNRTMFSPSRATTPTYAETPTGKTIGQYRTAYAYKQTGFIYDRVIKEAKNGNLKPLIKYLGVSAPIAGGTIAIKNKLSGNKEGVGGIAMDAAGALGGLPGEAALQLLRYGKRDLPKAIAGEVAPLAGEAVTAAENAQKALKGNLKPLGREALGMIPIAGSRISKAVLPPAKKANSGTNTAANSPTGKKLTIRQLKGNNPDDLTRWEGMTAKARANVRLNNPDKYIRDQNLKVQQDQAQGNTTQAFKDNRAIQQTQIQKSFDKNTIGAYSLNATDFKAFVAQASPTQLAQLHNLDNQLVNAGLVAKSKFPKAKTSKSGGSRVASGRRSSGSGRVRSSRRSGGSSSGKSTQTKVKVPSFKITGVKGIKPPKGVKVKKLAAFKAPKTRKLAVSKIPKIG